MANLIVDFSALKKHDLYGVFFDRKLNNKIPRSAKYAKNFNYVLVDGLNRIKKHLQQFNISNFKKNTPRCHIVESGDPCFQNLHKILFKRMNDMFNYVSQFGVFSLQDKSFSNHIYSLHFSRQQWVLYFIASKEQNKIIPFFVDIRHCIWPSKSYSIENFKENELLDWKLNVSQKNSIF